MKKYSYSLILSIIYIFAACSNSNQNTNTATDTTNKKPDTSISKASNAQNLDTADVSFFENAAYGGMIEVESSNKILQESKDTAIKTFAEMMVKDHTEANTKLKAIATDKGYILPALLPESKQAVIKKMDTYKQEGRDEYYIQLMISEHKNAINLFSAASRSHDTTISKFASGLLPTLNHHYQHTLKIDTALKAVKTNQGDDPLKISNRKKQ
jgi:putative membrane protein